MPNKKAVFGELKVLECADGLAVLESTSTVTDGMIVVIEEAVMPNVMSRVRAQAPGLTYAIDKTENSPNTFVFNCTSDKLPTDEDFAEHVRFFASFFANSGNLAKMTKLLDKVNAELATKKREARVPEPIDETIADAAETHLRETTVPTGVSHPTNAFETVRFAADEVLWRRDGG